MSSPPCVDIAIVNYFSARDVGRCLQRLGPWRHGTIWLIDNSHDAAEAAALQQLAGCLEWVRLVDAGGNLGFGRACNLAFERSRSELFLLLNPDAQAAPADLLVLAQALRDDPGLGAVSPRMYWNEARTFLLPEAFPQTPWSAVAQVLALRFRGLTRQAARRYLARQRRQMAAAAPFDVGFLAGAVMMVRRAAVAAAGGLFDPAYFMFYEDADLSLRLRRSGWRLAVAPAAAAVHEYRHKAFKADMMARSRDRYYRQCYPAFHALTGGLLRVDRLARPVPPGWFDQSAGRCRTLAEFAGATAGAGVLALSPSMSMMPALFRPAGQAGPLTPAEWQLLEPAQYVALMQDAAAGALPRWVHFERLP